MKFFLEKLKSVSILTVLLSTFIIFSSCDEDKREDTADYNAIVIQTKVCVEQDIKPGYLIKINDFTSGVPANSTGNIFNAINLPEDLKEINYPVVISFRSATEAEIDDYDNEFCYSDNFPSVYILSAKKTW